MPIKFILFFEVVMGDLLIVLCLIFLPHYFFVERYFLY